MGYSSYSVTGRTVRASSLGYDSKPREAVFKQRQISSEMDPNGVKVRESRDSVEHPESLAIIVALDVTGSMGDIPHLLIKDGLPTMVSKIIQAGVPDAQILFLAVGDHECDDAPLQVSQFECGDLELDKWLTSVWLEGGGGANRGESYGLAHYFAAHHTAIDCFEKRNQKGFLFTIGDEPNLNKYPKYALKKIMGDGQYQDYTSKQLIDEASEKYNVFHINIDRFSLGRDNDWKSIIGQGLLTIKDYNEIPNLISKTVITNYSQNYSKPVINETVTVSVENIDVSVPDML